MKSNGTLLRMPIGAIWALVFTAVVAMSIVINMEIQTNLFIYLTLFSLIVFKLLSETVASRVPVDGDHVREIEIEWNRSTWL